MQSAAYLLAKSEAAVPEIIQIVRNAHAIAPLAPPQLASYTIRDMEDKLWLAIKLRTMARLVVEIMGPHEMLMTISEEPNN